MKVLVVGKIPEQDTQIWKHTCWSCGSVLEYNRSDIVRSERTKEGHVVCPVCKNDVFVD